MNERNEKREIQEEERVRGMKKYRGKTGMSIETAQHTLKQSEATHNDVT